MAAAAKREHALQEIAVARQEAARILSQVQQMEESLVRDAKTQMRQYQPQQQSPTAHAEVSRTLFRPAASVANLGDINAAAQAANNSDAGALAARGQQILLVPTAATGAIALVNAAAVNNDATALAHHGGANAMQTD